MITKFVVGKTYQVRSMCDWDCIFSFDVVSRTEKTVILKKRGDTYRRKIYVVDDVEWCIPLGNYSMCPIITADKEIIE